ncbi:MAG TPA: ATP-binding protein [Longimicrobium sp.]|nr:ATP-binding protein [Longimicrobium sp.]
MPETADVLRDPARLAALAATGLLDSPPAEVFDRLTRLAARLLRAPMAALSLLDDRRQFFMSQCGFPAPLAAARETPVEHSVCRRVVASAGPVTVGDATREPWLAGNPLVTELGVRAYAGFPVSTRAGQVLGSFCVCDTSVREWDGEALETLRELAELAALEVERRPPMPGSARAERLLADAEGWFRSLVEQSIMGIYCIQDGRFRYVNPHLAEVFGYSREEMEQADGLLRVVHPDDRERVAENIRRRLSGELPALRYSFRGIRADGAVLYLEVHGSRTDMDGRPALVGVGYDTTERVRAEREREAAMQSRDRFYAMASHELRTPVSTVMLYNDLLLGGMYEPLTEQQHEAVERSQGSARHLLDLINDLLDLSKLEAGRLDARRDEVDAASLVGEVIAELTPLAAEHGSLLALEPSAGPVVVVGDGKRIRQILLNLLSNAIKFGAGRPIEVRCASDGDGGVAISVRDYGPGIAPVDLPRIWEDFVQLGDGDDTGTGLGLPIARRLAELLGGSLEVDSAPGSGSTFRFRLPSASSDS